MKIRARLAMGFLVVALLLWGVVYLALDVYSDIDRELDVLDADTIPSVIEVGELRVAAQEASHWATEYVQSGSERDKQAVLSALDTLKNTALAHLERDTGEEQHTEDLLENIYAYSGVVESQIQLKDRGMSTAELQMRDRDVVHPMFDILSEQLDEYRAAELEELAGSQEAVHEAKNAGQRELGIGIGLITFLAVAVAWVTTRSIVKPLHALHIGTEAIGQGNLDYRVGTKAKDEIGQLSRAFDQMTEDLGKSTTSIESLNREITERKRAEQELRQSAETIREVKESYDRIIDNADEVIFRVKAEGGHVIYANPAAERLLGYTQAEWLADSTLGFKIIHPDFVEKQKQIIGEINTTKKTIKSAVLGWITKDGREIIVEYTVIPVTDEKGEIIYFESIGRDITERKRVEEALRENEERFRSVVETATDAVISIDSDGNITYWNRAAEGVFGYSSDEALGKPIISIVPERFHTAHENALKRAASTGESRIVGETVEVPGFRRDGSEFPVELALARWKLGERLFFTAILRDITERKRMEQQLQDYSENLERMVEERTQKLKDAQAKLAESEERYRELFEHAGDAIVVYDRNWVMQGWNRRAEEMFGYRAEEVVGRQWESLNPPAESELGREARRQAERLVAEVGKKGFYHGREMVSRMTKDGRPLPVEASGAVIRDKGGKFIGFSAIFRDISRRKRLEKERERYARRLEAKIEEVERTKAELEEAQEQLVVSERMAAIGKLASIVSHELRNPLGVISNSAYYLKMVLGDGGEKVKRHLDILEKEVAICSGIIGDLLDFARPKEPELAEADINSIVEQTLSRCQVPGNVELVTELGEGLPKVMADGDQMQQVFCNLFLNAAQAMPQGGKLTVRTAHRDNLVQAEFADTGMGIPRDNLAKIFQPLFSTKAKGTGLGLAVTKSILDRHGGTIEVASEEGKGTTFTVSLPVGQAGEEKP